MKNRGIRSFCALLVGSTAVAAMPSTSWAQGAPSDIPAAGENQSASSAVIDDIIVTARRREESIQQVPVAVTAVSQERLTQASVLKAEDLPRLAPGLTVTANARGDSSPNYTIRGQRGSIVQTSLTDPAVPVYFAEVPSAHATGTNSSLYDLASIQVLKGPQGALFGRNSTAGAILIEPNKPSDRLEGYLSASAGNYGYSDLEGMLNLPLTTGVALRGAAKIARRDGYFENLTTGQKLNNIHSNSYRLSLQLDPADGITSTFIGTYYSSDAAGPGSKLAYFNPIGVPGIPPALRNYVIAQVTPEVALQNAAGYYKYRGSAGNLFRARDEVKSLQNKTTIDLGDNFSLKNIIGYRKVENDNTNDFAGASVDLFFAKGIVRTHQFSEEIQVQGGFKIFKFSTGLFYFKETARDKTVSRQLTLLSAIAPANFPIFAPYDVDVKSESYAAYAHLDADLAGIAEGLSISAGGRMTRDRRAVVYHSILQGGGSGPATYTCLFPTARSIAADDRNLCAYDAGSIKSSEPTYEVSLNYQITPKTLIYLAHRRGYRAGSFVQVPSAVDLAGTSTFKPEFVRDAELGLKTDFTIAGMKGRLNTAGYYQWYSDIQRSVSVPLGNAVVSLVRNVAEAHVYGGEMEFYVRPVEGLEIGVNYAYTKAKYDSFTNRYRDASGAPVSVDISDSPFGFVPKSQYSITASYDIPVAEGIGTPTLRVFYYGVSKQFTADSGPVTCQPPGSTNKDCLNREFVLPAYSLVNLRLDWTHFAGTAVDLSLFVNNLTKKHYATFGQNTLAGLGTASQYPGAPRMFGAALKVPFGESH